jgi:beta-lactamase regulating signal transducer with metallopeptidase domain
MMAEILDHLWQSTLVALGIALLTLAFRKASAGVRYGLWFAASVKFLVPFAALAMLGSVLAPEVRAPVVTAPQAAFIVRAAQPFSQAPLSYAAARPTSPLPAYAPPVHAAPHLDLGLILLAVWVLGCVAVLARWMVRSATVRRAVRSAIPLRWPAPMPVLASSSLWEPGLVGLWRPVLLVPESLPHRLAPPEIDAIVAHEACHLRRRDNLTAAIHMLVEALFWFHPLVWWIGARLIEERERACDEAVVTAGHNRAAYARSLVESCRLYLQSPLSCVAGASGSNLKTRVETIMTAPPSSPLSAAGKTFLVAAGVCAVATPVTAGLLTSPAGQQAVAHAAAVAASFAPSRAAAAAAPEPQAGQTVTLSRLKSVLAPASAVAASDAPSLPLTQDAPMRLAALEPAPSAPAQAAPTSQAAKPADLQVQAANFVQSYAAATGKRRAITRWGAPICVRVVGLAPPQAAAVRARIEEVAGAAGVGHQPADCKRSDIEIGFTSQPQAMLDDVIAHRSWLLGDATSETQTVKTVTHPIQAWYRTNGGDVADASAPNLKSLVVYQDQSYFTTGAGAPGSAAPEGDNIMNSLGPGAAWPDGARVVGRQFVNVFVIVDVQRIGGRSLGPVVDDVAMLALSQPRSLGSCNVLPSVTDLFAESCGGRAAPAGLTPTDAAYLTALYGENPGADKAAGPPSPVFFPDARSDLLFAQERAGRPARILLGSAKAPDVAERMARILAATKVASR